MRIGPPTKAGRYGTALDAAMHDFERAEGEAHRRTAARGGGGR